MAHHLWRARCARCKVEQCGGVPRSPNIIHYRIGFDMFQSCVERNGGRLRGIAYLQHNAHRWALIAYCQKLENTCAIANKNRGFACGAAILDVFLSQQDCSQRKNDPAADGCNCNPPPLLFALASLRSTILGVGHLTTRALVEES